MSNALWNPPMARDTVPPSLSETSRYARGSSLPTFCDRINGCARYGQDDDVSGPGLNEGRRGVPRCLARCEHVVDERYASAQCAARAKRVSYIDAALI